MGSNCNPSAAASALPCFEHMSPADREPAAAAVCCWLSASLQTVAWLDADGLHGEHLQNQQPLRRSSSWRDPAAEHGERCVMLFGTIVSIACMLHTTSRSEAGVSDDVGRSQHHTTVGSTTHSLSYHPKQATATSRLPLHVQTAPQEAWQHSL